MVGSLRNGVLMFVRRFGPAAGVTHRAGYFVASRARFFNAGSGPLRETHPMHIRHHQTHSSNLPGVPVAALGHGTS